MWPSMVPEKPSGSDAFAMRSHWMLSKQQGLREVAWHSLSWGQEAHW